MLVRDWRAGELRLLLAATSLAIAIVIGISAFTNQLKTTINNQSHQFLAADRVINSSQKIAGDWLIAAERQHLRQAREVTFNSMLASGQGIQLTRVKAVSSTYPLRGQLQIKKHATGPAKKRVSGPKTGEIWLEQRLLDQLKIDLGSAVEIGDTRLRVTAILVAEPDRASSLISIAPHALMSLDDLAATRVIQPGSRVSYRYLFAGRKEDLSRFRQWLRGRMTDNQSWVNIRTAQPAIATALERAERFLLLAGTLGIALAGIAIAISARRYSQRHCDHVALMKCFGANRRQILKLYLQQLFWLAIMAMVIGSLLGWGIEGLLARALGQYVHVAVTRLDSQAIAMATLTAITCLLAFAFPPLVTLSAIPPLRVLRQDLGNPRTPVLSGLISGFLSMTLLMWFYSQNLPLTLSLLIGAVTVFAIVGGSIWLLLRWQRGEQHLATGRWRLALASLRRHRGQNALQTTIFSLTITLLLTLFLVRTTLLEEWQAQLPAKTPNHFLINILPTKVTAMEQWIKAQNTPHSDLYPGHPWSSDPDRRHHCQGTPQTEAIKT